MSDHQDFITKAKKRLEKIGSELDEIEHKVKSDYRETRTWYAEQMTKLRKEWQDAHRHVENLSSDAEAEARATYRQARSDAERHWSALQAAVQTYRERVEKDAA